MHSHLSTEPGICSELCQFPTTSPEVRTPGSLAGHGVFLTVSFPGKTSETTGATEFSDTVGSTECDDISQTAQHDGVVPQYSRMGPFPHTDSTKFPTSASEGDRTSQTPQHASFIDSETRAKLVASGEETGQGVCFGSATQDPSYHRCKTPRLGRTHDRGIGPGHLICRGGGSSHKHPGTKSNLPDPAALCQRYSC